MTLEAPEGATSVWRGNTLGSQLTAERRIILAETNCANDPPMLNSYRNAAALFLLRIMSEFTGMQFMLCGGTMAHNCRNGRMIC